MKEISFLKQNKQKGNSYKEPYKKKSIPKHIKRSAKAKVKNQVRDLLKLDRESLMNEDFIIDDEDILTKDAYEKEFYDDPFYDEEDRIVRYVKDPYNKDGISELVNK